MKKLLLLGLTVGVVAIVVVAVLDGVSHLNSKASALRKTAPVVTHSASSPASSPSTPASTGLAIPAGVKLRQIDGGRHYFGSLDARSAWMDTTMLLGAWEEQPLSATDVSYDVQMGNNIYWNVAGTPQNMSCGGPCLVEYGVMRAGGMHLCTPNPPDSTSGSETVCTMVGDELDMTSGPNPSAAEQAFDSSPVPGVITYQGYGKGVLFWETNAQASQFLKYSDLLAADSYWMTDPSLEVASQGGCALLPESAACLEGNGLTAAQTALPANYAYNVTRLEYLESLDGGSKPVVVDVETGCPMTNGECTTPAAFTAAAWHAIIAGARGIIWFQHNFSGPCIDYNTFYDGSNPASSMHDCRINGDETLSDIVSAVSAVNHEILGLNRVLLSPFADNYVSVGDADVSVMAKYSGRAFYVFAASGLPADPPPYNQTVTFRVAGGYTGNVYVVGEHRVLHAVDGVFTDTFADADSFHIYKLDGSGSSSPPSSPGPSPVALGSLVLGDIFR
ncbi:MAG TPA: hypothetical protein VEL03_02335 [Streptosporangiaceae bacterium]|nr:hypothetical protein [Streptosporangiaceae bacterium]